MRVYFCVTQDKLISSFKLSIVSPLFRSRNTRLNSGSKILVLKTRSYVNHRSVESINCDKSYIRGRNQRKVHCNLLQGFRVSVRKMKVIRDLGFILNSGSSALSVFAIGRIETTSSEKFEGIIRRQIKMSVLPSVQPFHTIAYPIDPVLALEISGKYAAHCALIASRFALPPFIHPPRIPVKSDIRSLCLRVGYVSSDFGNNTLSHLMGLVFGMHNRENVEGCIDGILLWPKSE